MKTISNTIIGFVVFALAFFIGTYMGVSIYDYLNPVEPVPLVINTERANIEKITVYEPSGEMSTEIEADMQMTVDGNVVRFRMKE